MGDRPHSIVNSGAQTNQCEHKRSQDLRHWHAQMKGNAAVNTDTNVREVNRVLTI